MSKKNVVSIEDRLPGLKQERKKKKNRRIIFYLSIFFFLLSIIVYLQSPLSYIKTISITGNNILSDEEILKQTRLTNKTNIWTMNKGEVIGRLKKDSFVKDAKLKRKFPQSVEIHINEYELVGYIEKANSYFPIVENGNILTDRKQNSVKGNAPLLVNFKEDDHFESMVHELAQLQPTLLDAISEVHWNPDDKHRDNKILLYMKDGYVVSTAIRDFAKKMVVYPSIVSQLESDEKGIVHIGVGAYFESFETDQAESDEPER
ncbi:MAG TPA: FtsQ-type POTRA domain-containing protein [Bacillota bacterium]